MKSEGAIAGLGLFATEDIEAGNLIFCEKVMFVSFGYEEDYYVMKSRPPQRKDLNRQHRILEDRH